jgi:acetyl esterase/lipase
MGRSLVWLLASVAFFLSLWIVLPAPNLFFLRLAVGAPEISPGLGLGGAIAIALAVKLYKWRPPRLLIGLIVATLALSSLPLLQQPQAIAQANASMAKAFGTGQAIAVPSDTHSFSWSNFVRGIPQAQIRYRANIPFAMPAGVPLVLDLYQPLASGKYPAVITIYGGAWRQGSPLASANLGRFLAARGYVVIAIDYRHAPQYRFPAQLEDVQTALAFINDHADEYEVDKTRLALLGWSAGAHLAMLSGFQTQQMQASEKVKGIISYYGPINLTAGYQNPPKPDPINSREVLLAFIGGSPTEFPDAYVQASPITYVKPAKAASSKLPPTLLIYGGRDHVVEAKYGKKLYDALIDSGHTAVWVKIPWAEHAFDEVFNGVSNQLALHFIEQFLVKIL